MYKITPHLWFNTQAKEAAEFYVATFQNSKVNSVQELHGTPSGDTEIVSFEIDGQSFMAISAGPIFTPNPSISFLLNYDPSVFPDAEERLRFAWARLLDGGTVMMELQEYPHSKCYGWVQDKFGVSWQLMLTNPEGEKRPFVTPSLMFVGEVAGKAEEALDLYVSVFGGTRGTTARYPAGMPDEGKIMYADIKLFDGYLAGMDSSGPHKFHFTEGISLMVSCDSQEEIDRYWSALSAHPESEQCGWLKDKFGVSWQVTPTEMGTMMETGTPGQIDRVTKAFLKMKKFDIDTLRQAFRRRLDD